MVQKEFDISFFYMCTFTTLVVAVLLGCGQDTDNGLAHTAVGKRERIAGSGRCMEEILHDGFYFDDGSYVFSNSGSVYGQYADTGTSATAISFGELGGIDLDLEGKALFADHNGGRIFRIESDGTLTRIAGPALPNVEGDRGLSSGPATSVLDIYLPLDLAVQPKTGNVYFVEKFTGYVKFITAATGNMATLAGGSGFFIIPDGPIASDLPLGRRITGLDVDEGGNVYTVDFVYDFGSLSDIRVLSTGARTIATLAQDMVDGFDIEDNGSTLYYTDRANHRIYTLPKTGGMPQVLAGTGDIGYTDHATDATQATFYGPRGLYAKPNDGPVYVADAGNGAIRKIMADGSAVTTIVANAGLVADLVLDDVGDIFYTDRGTCSVYRVTGPY